MLQLKKNVYSIRLKSPTSYEILDDKACTYALVISPDLAYIFQAPSCVTISNEVIEGVIDTRAPANSELEGYGDGDFWFSMMPSTEQPS